MSFFYMHSLKNENRERRWILNPGHSKKRFGVCLCLFRRLDEKLSMFFKNVRVFGHSG